MGVEAVLERTFYRLGGNAPLPNKRQACELCLAIGKTKALNQLRTQLSIAAKVGRPVDLNGLRWTITELENLTEEEIAQKTTELKPLSIYRIPPEPTPEEEEAQYEQRREQINRETQEWLDSELSEDKETDYLGEDEDSSAFD